ENMRNELNDLIDDTPIEDDENENGSRKSKRRRKSNENYDDRLEDDDYELLEENLGITVDRIRFKRLKIVQNEESDEEESITNEREAIANELFEGGSDNEDDKRSEISHRPKPSSEINENNSDEESSDADDFIVDDEGRPITKKHEKKRAVCSNPALQQAQDIFGIDFDYEEFKNYEDDNDDDDESDEDDENGERPRKRRKSEMTKRTKKTIFDIYEPSELKRGHLTDIDDEIRNCDLPERMQLRSTPITPVPEDSDELDHEAEWIYQQAFNRPTISSQTTRINADPELVEKGPQIVAKLKIVLDYMRNRNLEVPFISFYRKEIIKPELNMNDLWKVYKYDAKWCELRQRKNNLLALFENMRNFQLDEIMKNPDAPLSDDVRIIKEDDIDRLKNVETDEEFNDIHHHFMLYYSQDIPAMKEIIRIRREIEHLEKIEKRRREIREAEENGEDPPPEIEMENLDKNEFEDNIKHALRTGPYAVCKKLGLESFAKKFGLTPEQFAENLRDNYQRHEIEQEPVEPNIIAQDYVASKFKSSDEVMKAVQLMVAIKLSREPLVRKCVREMYLEKAKLSVKPTKKGIKEIDENHSIYTMKYLKDKPVRELSDDQFLKLSIAENDKLINITFSDNIEGITGDDYIQEVKQLYVKDEFSRNVQDWNNLRVGSVEKALTQMIIPDLKKELRAKLISESKEYVLHACCAKMFNWIKTAPYTCEFPEQEDEKWNTSDGVRVMAISYVPDYNQAAFACIVAPNGMYTTHLKLPHLLKRNNSFREEEKALKEADLLALRNFISNTKPHVIVISGKSREATAISYDVKDCIATLVVDEQFPTIEVEIMDDELARIYANSNIGITEFRDFPESLREAISLARRLQDPLAEFSQLCTPDEEILCLKYHKLQDHLPKQELLENLYLEFVNRVNEVGVDVNKAIKQDYSGNLLQFVCGLGPRKSQALIKIIRRTIQKLENRTQLITACHMGPKIFINCAGFIKIDTENLGDIYEDDIEMLDGSRVHPETYEWAKKMAMDALEIDDPIEAMKEIFKTPDRLKELDLDAFADELQRQGCGNKRITLYDIRAELSSPYKDLRSPYMSPTPEELFDILTKETPETFYIGKLVLATVIGMNYKKPDTDQLDQANPVRSDETGFWQCPFCMQNDFPEMSDVWNHFDVGTCPGKANGVRLRLENGISGFIHIKNISDSHVECVQTRVKQGQSINCRVTKIQVDRFSVECSSKSSDLADSNNEWRPAKDSFYDTQAEEDDIKSEENLKKNTQQQVYLKRLTFHPLFHNITYFDAEKMMKSMNQGDVIIRPSSKGSDHLSITWNVTNDICQHIDVVEEQKDNEFSLGKKLWIGDEEFEDLDEIIARHINPMASNVVELLNHRKYNADINGDHHAAENLLKERKKICPQEIPYFISIMKMCPGKFLLSYLPRTYCKHESIRITPQGFQYRQQTFTDVEKLLIWFKKHFRDPIPRPVPPVASSKRTSAHATPGTLSNMDSDAIARVAQNLPNDMLHSLSQVANQTPFPPCTPGVPNTPAYSHVNACPNTPYTPSGATPFMTPFPTPHFTPFDSQETPRYGQTAPNDIFLHPSVLTNHNIHQKRKPMSNRLNNANDDQFDWQTNTSTEKSNGEWGSQTDNSSENANGDTYDWKRMGHTGRNNRGGKSQSWSRQSNPSNNNENNNSGNWRPRGRGRSMRGNIHRGGKVASSSQFNSSSSANDDSFDWGSGSTTTNQNSSSTNNTDATAFDWGTGGTSTNENVSSINNTDAGAFDWGTSGASTNNTNTNEFDWGTSGESSDRNEISTNNRDNNTQGWKRNRAGQPINNNRGGRSQSWSRSNSSNNRNNDSGNWRSRGGGRSTRGNFNQRSASSSQQFNSSNNAEDDSFDWGTGGNSTSQNKSATDNTDAGAFDWGTGGGSTNHNESSTNNANDTFDWGTSATSTNQNETSTNNTNADTYDWGTNSGSTGQDDTLTNNANDDTYDFKRNKSWQSSGRNNRDGRAQSWSSRRSSLSSNGDNNSSNWRPRGRGRGGSRENFNRRSSSSSQQFNSTSGADDNSFDWGTGGSSTNQNESTAINNTDAAAFDWGTGDVSTKQNETSNNTNDDNWGRNKNDQSRRNSRGNRSQSWSRQSEPNNNSCQDSVDDDASFDWGTGPSTQSANQSTSMNNADDDNSEWGTATGFTSQSQDVSCNGDNDASTDWQTLEPS
ncbi:hypothetical protein PV325_007644, partial [Microctonus aethiopoides]